MSPALAGGFSTTAPPGKSLQFLFNDMGTQAKKLEAPRRRGVSKLKETKYILENTLDLIPQKLVFSSSTRTNTGTWVFLSIKCDFLGPCEDCMSEAIYLGCLIQKNGLSGLID